MAYTSIIALQRLQSCFVSWKIKNAIPLQIEFVGSDKLKLMCEKESQPITVYSDFYTKCLEYSFPGISQEEFSNLPDPFDIYLGLPIEEYEAMTNGRKAWNCEEWTTDPGRAECCAYGVFGEDKGVVLRWSMPKKYAKGVDAYFYYLWLDIEQAIKDGVFTPEIVSEHATELLKDFIRDESERRFK